MADTLSDALNLSESLEQSDIGTVIRVDNDLRTLKPDRGIMLGVYNDKDVRKISFEMPRYYDGLDLSTFKIRVNIQNGNGYRDSVEVTRPTFSGDMMKFDWVLNRFVFEKEGTVLFNVCLKTTDSTGNRDKEFNTTIANGIVLEGLEVDDTSKQSVLYILESLLLSADENDGIVVVGDESFTTEQLTSLISYLKGE